MIMLISNFINSNTNTQQHCQIDPNILTENKGHNLIS